MSELSIARHGPLAHVWLASNYDKKLSRQQFLNTNIVSSSNLIASRQIESTSSTSPETITLRLSGQLLLGIVRIYSRKTKYLLDDIHETLYKLKNSFRIASGATLGSAAASSVNLPAQKTTLTNLSRITLQDQITSNDLFYQEDLVLDEADPFSDLQIPQGNAEVPDISDRSIEYPRGEQERDEADSNFDLDLGLDDSIEIGRDAQAPLSDMDQSSLDFIEKPVGENQQSNPFDLGQPLEVVDVLRQTDTDRLHEAEVSTDQVPRRRRTVTGISDSGIIRTAKRRLVVDTQDDLERGLPNEVLRNIQSMQTSGRFSEETLTIELTPQEKLDLINELALPLNKRRKTFSNIDLELRQRCVELSTEEERLDDPHQLSNTDIDTTLDFDLSIPGIDSEDLPSPKETLINEEDMHPDTVSENTKTTAQVAEYLRELFYDQPRVSINDLMEKQNRSDETDMSKKRTNRRQATECFFELLVLASHNCVHLEQDVPKNDIEIPSGLQIRPKDSLVSSFL